MISMRSFALILLTMLCRELIGPQPQTNAARATLCIATICLAFGLLAKCLAALAVTRHLTAARPTSPDRGTVLGSACKTTSSARVDRSLVSGRFLRYRQALDVCWIGLLPITLCLTSWGGWLAQLEDLNVPQFVVIGGWFLPSILFVLFVEVAASQLDCLLAGEDEDLFTSWFGHWRLRVRLGEFSNLATCITPVLMIAALSDGLAWSSWGLTHEQIAGISSVFALVLIACLLPYWLGLLMGARSMPDGQLRQLIQHMASELGIRNLPVQVVHSQQRWMGAAVVGWFPGSRRLWIGDGLIDRLTPRQLQMVVLHEFAHVVRWHFVTRALPVLWALAAGGLIVALTECLPAKMALPPTYMKVIAIVPTLSILVVGLGASARSCELDADRCACQLAARICAWETEQPGTAAAELAHALQNLLGDSAYLTRSTWLHPSLRQRLASLADARYLNGAVSTEPLMVGVAQTVSTSLSTISSSNRVKSRTW